MRLSKVLRITGGTAIAFTGAGGKTSAIHRLVEELNALYPTVVSTTTKLGRDQSTLAQQHLVFNKNTISALQAHLDGGDSVLVTAPPTEDGLKWTGLPMPEMEDLWRSIEDRGGILLIEADGARGRSLKAPAEHEPAVPRFVNLVVPTAGIDAIGERVSSELIHRPEILQDLLGMEDDEPISVNRLTALLTHPEGGLKGVPEGSEVRVLLNKIRTAVERKDGKAIADGVLLESRVSSVVLADLFEEEPVLQSVCRVGGVILAAGESSRFGSQKLVHEFKGRPLVQYAVDAARAGGLDPIVVVLGADADQVRASLDAGTKVVLNPDWEKGQSSSLKVGLEKISAEVEAAAFLLADMPGVDEKLIMALVDLHGSTLAEIVAPRVGDRWGNPALFDRRIFAELNLIEGDQGGRALFGRYPPVGMAWGEVAALDVDSYEDIRRLTRKI